jgi:hypothetical protein
MFENPKPSCAMYYAKDLFSFAGQESFPVHIQSQGRASAGLGPLTTVHTEDLESAIGTSILAVLEGARWARVIQGRRALFAVANADLDLERARKVR